MKHFIVEITYTEPWEKIEPVVPEHRLFLQGYYDKGMLLMSGPQNPKVGGILVAKAESLQQIEAMIAEDPYNKHTIATYRIVEFNPVKYQDWMKSWVE